MAQPQLTPRTFSSIATDLVTGRPLWGILRLNELHGCDPHIRAALRTRAERALTEGGSSLRRSVAQKIFSGARLDQLTPAEQRVVVNHEMGSSPTPRSVPVRLIPHRARAAQRAHRRVRRRAHLEYVSRNSSATSSIPIRQF